MKNELVSVVMCTYNGSRFVEEQLESICKQTHAELEIIVVDDASTDDSYALLLPWAQKDARIRLYHNEKNIGFNLNFNKACGLTTGSFIAIADQDDIWEPAKIAILLAAIRDDPDALLAHCISARFEKFGKFHLRSHRLVNYNAGQDVKNFFLSNFISGHNMLIRRKLLEQSLPFHPAVYYDWWLAAVASCNGKIISVPQVLVWHRMHDSNATGAAKPRIYLYKQVQTIVPELMRIPQMREADKAFAARLLTYYKVFPRKRFSWPLFLFLWKHVDILFAQKKRALPLYFYIKYPLKAARASTLA